MGVPVSSAVCTQGVSHGAAAPFEGVPLSSAVCARAASHGAPAPPEGVPVSSAVCAAQAVMELRPQRWVFRCLSLAVLGRLGAVVVVL